MGSNQEPLEFIQYHKDGSVWAKGQLVGDTPYGYWEWFRKYGTLMRSGTFRDGIQVGEWTTFNPDGTVKRTVTHGARR